MKGQVGAKSRYGKELWENGSSTSKKNTVTFTCSLKSDSGVMRVNCPTVLGKDILHERKEAYARAGCSEAA